MKNVFVTAIASSLFVSSLIVGCVPVVSPEETTLIVDTSKVDTSKVDTSKVDTSKIDTSKIDTSKVDTSKVDTSKVDTAYTKIYTAESDYTTGIIGEISNGIYQKSSLAISSDAVMVEQKGDIYVLERTESNIMKLSASGAVVYQEKLLNGFNPHDLVVVNSSKGYVCSNSTDSIAIVNPMSGAVISYLSLSAYVKPGITTNATKMILVGSHLYVACQMRAGYSPDEGSLILKIDTNSDQIVDSIRCTFKNVIDMDLFNGNLVVTSMGSYSAVDGGVELVSLSSNTVTTLTSGTRFGADISSMAVDQVNREFYGTLYRSWGDAPIVHFNEQFAPLDTIGGVVQANAPQYDSIAQKLYFSEVGSSVAPAIVIWDPLQKTKLDYASKLPVQSIVFVTTVGRK